MRERLVRPPVDASLLAQLHEQHVDGFMAFRSVREDGRIADFEWIYANPAAARLVGRSVGELEGRRLLVEMPGNRAVGLFESYVEVVERGAAFTRELEYRHEGLDACFRAVAVPLGDGFAVWFSDVTARVRAERELKASEARFRRIAESGIVGIAFWDASGAITGANDAFLSLTGYDRAELEAGAISWRRMTPPEWEELDRRVMQELQERRVSAAYEKEYFRKDGTRVPVLVAGAHLDDTGTDGVACIVDLTERKRAEEFQRRLIGIAGHDLRSPLAAIVAGATVIARAPDVPERRRETARRLLSSAGRMDRIIRDLVDYTRERVGAGIAIERRDAELVAICHVTMDEISAAFPGRRLDCSTEGPVRALVDPARVAQIVQNLATNALQHGAPDRPVTIAVRAEGEDGVIEVHNEGPPIAASELPRLFEPFHRVSTRGRTGLGLGLFIVERLAVAHGGRVEVRSDAAAGTTFSVRLPLHPR